MAKVKEITDVRYSIGGAMGRGYLTLPCEHQDVRLNWFESQPGAQCDRTCRTCRRVYRIWLNNPREHLVQVKVLRVAQRKPKPSLLTHQCPQRGTCDCPLGYCRHPEAGEQE